MESTDTEDVKLEIEAEPEPAPEVTVPDAERDPAAEAFARLEGELALMRRAVEHLASERADIVIPDYGTTLSGMAKSLNEMDARLEAMADHPALQITPDMIGNRIAAAAEIARRTDQERMNITRTDLQQAIHSLQSINTNARTAADQQRQLYRMAGGGLLAGILLWSFLPGTIARAVPESWQWPEQMAARMVGERSEVEAGIRLIRSKDPKQWDAIASAAKLERENRQALAKCHRASEKLQSVVKCAVRISP